MVVERLRKQDIFQLLRPEQVNQLSEASKVETLRPGAIIYSRGEKADRFYIVLKGHVSLRLPEESTGLSVVIDEVTEGQMFGGCISASMDTYALNAHCTVESEILVISVSALLAIMDEDPRTGYSIQSRISEVYFKRYIEVMAKLQKIVMNIPVEPS